MDKDDTVILSVDTDGDGVPDVHVKLHRKLWAAICSVISVFIGWCTGIWR